MASEDELFSGEPIKKPEKKFYRLNCEICGYNKMTDGINIKLVEYQRSKIQRRLPYFSEELNKTVLQEFQALPKKFKCPGCGRLLGPRNVKEVVLEKDENQAKVIYEKDIVKGNSGGFERF